MGKTYAMLQAAHEQLAKGVDLVVAWVETHGRPETEALLKGLPVLSPRTFTYRGTTLFEPDYEAVLARRPAVVVVDELAHTNAPGSVHARRYQDVRDLLAAGLDVFTTLNVQHLESLNDVVFRITGVTVRETVPDSFLEGAEIKLVDIPVEELLARLREGKVYVPELAGRALERFFRPGNLNALRELALRYTAQRVDASLSTYMRAHAIPGPWPVATRLMACVGPGPFSAQVIRAAARMAEGLQAQWLAVHVESPGWAPVPAAAREQLARNLQLAEELGAEVMVVTAADIAAELVRVARERNVSGIVIGQPLRRRWRELLSGTMVDRVVRLGQGMSVHVIPGPSEGRRTAAGPTAARASRGRDPGWGLGRAGGRGGEQPALTGREAAEVVFLVAAVAAALVALRDRLEPANVALLFLVPVLIGAARWRLTASVLAALLAALAFDFFFVPPTLSLSVADLRYSTVLVVFLAVGILVSTLASRQREQARRAQRRENRTAALYALSREMAAVDDLDRLVTLVARRAAEALGGRVCILLPGPAEAVGATGGAGGAGATGGAGGAERAEPREPRGPLEVRAWEAPPGTEPCPPVSSFPEKERAVAAWAFDHGEVAGAGTSTLSAAAGLYVPAVSEGRPVAVLGLQPPEPDRCLSPEQRGLLEAFAALAATAVARRRLAEAAYAARLARDSEKLQTVLLDAVAHELCTPLAAVLGSVTSLLEEPSLYGPRETTELLRTIKQEAARMNTLVRNLLDMARLESGTLRLNRAEWDIAEVIQAALSDRAEALEGRPVHVAVAPGLPPVSLDFVLIQQALGNLLDNAARYTAPGSEVTVGARRSGAREVEVSVGDCGPGIPPGELEKVFERAYRPGGTTGAGGTAEPGRAGAGGWGLGLSIAKGIVQAHGGRIWAEANPSGGTTVRFTLPVGGDQGRAED